jgi:hypothetical protein
VGVGGALAEGEREEASPPPTAFSPPLLLLGMPLPAASGLLLLLPLPLPLAAGSEDSVPEGSKEALAAPEALAGALPLTVPLPPAGLPEALAEAQALALPPLLPLGEAEGLGEALPPPPPPLRPLAVVLGLGDREARGGEGEGGRVAAALALGESVAACGDKDGREEMEEVRVASREGVAGAVAAGVPVAADCVGQAVREGQASVAVALGERLSLSDAARVAAAEGEAAAGGEGLALPVEPPTREALGWAGVGVGKAGLGVAAPPLALGLCVPPRPAAPTQLTLGLTVSVGAAAEALRLLLALPAPAWAEAEPPVEALASAVAAGL